MVKRRPLIDLVFEFPELDFTPPRKRRAIKKPIRRRKR